MRRFIAGAVCPNCREMDRIIIEEVPPGSLDGGAEGRRRRCVSCGFSDAMTAGGIAEPSTRFNRPRGADAPAAPVRIVTPPGKSE